jgi:hypothetical protein
MRLWTITFPGTLVAAFAGAQPTKKADDPKPGSRGNPDNVSYIGKSNPRG